MNSSEVEWAGVRFTPVYHHDARFFRGPGLFAFVRCDPAGERTLLFVDHADDIAAAVSGHTFWADALRLGLNELDVNLQAQSRIDRLVLRERIVRRCGPMLNVLHPPQGETEASSTTRRSEAPPASGLSLWPGRIRA